MKINNEFLKKLLLVFVIIFTTMFFVGICMNTTALRIFCTLVSLLGDVASAFFFGYVLGGENNGK